MLSFLQRDVQNAFKDPLPYPACHPSSSAKAGHPFRRLPAPAAGAAFPVAHGSEPGYHACMRTIRLIVEYDGSRYCGWQVQPNGPTVQAVLEEAVQAVTGAPARIRGASRTDSGVHACGQVAVFTTASDIPAGKFAPALTSRLPDDVAVRVSDEVGPDFDPRRAATRKCYVYRIANGPVRPVLDRLRVWFVKWPLDVGRMQAAAARFEGTHDFTSFSNQECNQPGADNTRTIDRFAVAREDERIVCAVEGRSFLYNMVRNLVGTLVDVGTGRFASADVDAMLEMRDRAAAGQGAPPQGLCLEWIRYD